MELYYFNAGEFQRGGENWMQRMDVRLLVLMDSLRHQWGRPIAVSNSPGSIGRKLGPNVTSKHNVELSGVVHACDIVPSGIRGDFDAKTFFDLCRMVGFTGIGAYADWRQGFGFHIDTRTSHRPGAPATWGRIDGEYTSIGQALEKA